MLKKLRALTVSRLNYYCIMLEGLFNLLGHDIIGMTTIVPLFLREYGASMTLVGATPTIQSVISAVTPLIAGQFIAAAKMKKKISLMFNGAARTLLLFIPLMLTFRLPNNMIIFIFFCIITFFYIGQSVTSIVWNYLMGACIQPEERGKLLGSLFALSGLVSFVSSNIVRILRETPSLTTDQRYIAIFSLGGIITACSVLFFVPLKETVQSGTDTQKRNVKFYINSLLRCCKNKYFVRLILCQAFSQICTTINAFTYVMANERIGLASQWISYMIIIQTVGVICGGFVTGRISTRYGSKRTLMLAEGIGFVVPLLQLTLLVTKQSGGSIFFAPGFMLTATFLMGFNRSGLMAFQSHLLEVAGDDNSVYYIVTKNMLLIPLSFTSVLVGICFDKFPNNINMIYIAQALFAVAAILFAARLKLFVYTAKKTG